MQKNVTLIDTRQFILVLRNKNKPKLLRTWLRHKFCLTGAQKNTVKFPQIAPFASC